MSVYINEIGGDAAVAQVNTGGKSQFIPKAVVEIILAKETQSFTDLATAKLEASWDSAKESKGIVPLYKVEELAAANSEESKFEGRFADVILKEAVKGSSYNMLLDDKSYAALKSYDESEYTRIYRVCEDGTIHCEAQDDGSIKGEPLSSINVGQLLETDLSKPQNASVEIKFKDYIKSTIKPAFAIEDYEGIYDVVLEVVGTPTATVLVLKAISYDSNSAIGSFVVADFTTENGSLDSVGYDSATEEYTFVCTGLASGDVSLDGVVVQTGIMYEAVAALAITI